MLMGVADIHGKVHFVGGYLPMMGVIRWGISRALPSPPLSLPSVIHSPVASLHVILISVCLSHGYCLYTV